MPLTETAAPGRVLVITLDGGGEVRQLRGGGAVTLGRSRERCDWVLPDPGVPATISRRHCRIALGPDGASVTDLESANGTRVDGRLIAPNLAVPLRGGEVLEIGPRRLRVGLEQAGTSAVPGLPGLLPPLGDDLPPDGPRLPGTGPAPRRPAPQAAMPAGDELDLFAPGPLSGAGPLEADPLAGAFTADLPPAPPRPGQPMGRRTGGAPQFEALSPAPPGRRTAPAEGDPMAETGRRPRPEEDADPFGIGPPRSPDAPPDASPAVPSAESGAVAALAAFLEGAGLEPDIATGRAPNAALREAGALFAALAGGVRDLLAMRAAIKDHAGLDRTQISAALNNPLKLSVSRREATAALLGPAEEGYLAPPAAVEAAFRDLTAHELALLDGVQSAVEELLALFEPKALERRLEDTGLLAALIQGGRRSMLWQLYQERYEEIAGAARSRFMGRLDDAFRAAYARKVAEVAGQPAPQDRRRRP